MAPAGAGDVAAAWAGKHAVPQSTECLSHIAAGCDNIEQVERFIGQLFTDDQQSQCVVLSLVLEPFFWGKRCWRCKRRMRRGFVDKPTWV